MFINYEGKRFLDRMGFALIGEVFRDYMTLVDETNELYGVNPDQGKIHFEGNRYPMHEFPNLDYVLKVSIAAGG